MEMLRYEISNAFCEPDGLTEDQVIQLSPQLEYARQETLDDLRLWKSQEKVPEGKQPLDASFIDLPERLLEEFRQQTQESELGQIMAAADQFSQIVDRVVVLGIGGSYMGARAMMEACCHPYHNQRDRSSRGGRPELYFEGNNVDNDASQGLLDLLGRGQCGSELGQQWGIIVISKSGGTLETAAAFRHYLAALNKAVASDRKELARRVIPVTGSSGKLFELSEALGCHRRFKVPDGVGGRFSVLSPVGLLPASLLGLDIDKLLQGAAAMNEHFRTSPINQNLVLRYVAVSHLMETKHSSPVRVLSTWSKKLEAVGLWYDQLLSESLGKRESGALPLTVVNTRDLHSRGQQHQEGIRDKIITNLVIDQWEREPLKIGTSQYNQDGLNDLADKTLIDIMHAALLGTNQAYRDDGRPTTDLILPRSDEASLGQLFQMLMLATVVEGRLIGTNPYGQPGVEAYKKNMDALLRESVAAK